MTKIWRIYEIVDIDTGELLNSKNYEKRNYITIKTEKNVTKQSNYNVETTRRYVKHNGQTTIF